jgi:spermidine/putrescine transport system permease protein
MKRALSLYAALVYLFVFAPIAFLVLFSFNANPSGSFPITGLTTRWYDEMLDDFELRDAFWTSLEVALQVTAVSVVVGAAAAFPLVRARLPFRNGIRLGVTLPIMLPGLLIGISLLILLAGVLDLELSSRTAVVGQCIFTTPFVILLVAARLQLLDPKLEWAAGDLGADTPRRIRHVVLPALAPALIGSALLAFTLSFDEFIITLFVIGGDQTLPLYIFNHVRYGITPSVNAVASLFLLGSFAVLTLALALPSGVRRVRRVRVRRLRGPVNRRRLVRRQHAPQQVD